MKTLLLYLTRDGQTHKIAQAIAQTIGSEQVELHDLMTLSVVDWSQYDKVIIGASIRYGHFAPQLMTFVQQYTNELNERCSAFYSVNLTARKPEKSTPETNVYTQKFLTASPWQPDEVAVFAGALRYPRYRWFDRFMIGLIMKMTGGETDKTKEVDYTQWDKVREFANTFADKKSKLLS
ncbi:menaquinone-dependent protoporphyrinogen IX dehydrogenase [Rosenbergiella australiborealis]|uniref:Protoporphyrinogen IX dehydrogenase [quinone] n=1 Tax=Rosenbergiella australiborealis TaxID=1544696 RepID=A0ABS5T9G4_9GAMM|nr:menaquinone-dependent protoporphyrinogen IX dehydrogenase [Rosenbergiella australiborealis]MBT0727603.1 menaquinone-dependent protoporphyrinogen IX dehydrogenase [Rosenbergiella australiborealis]